MHKRIRTLILPCFCWGTLVAVIGNAFAECPKSTVYLSGTSGLAPDVVATEVSDKPTARVSYGRGTYASYDRNTRTVEARAEVWWDEGYNYYSRATVVEHFALKGVSATPVTLRLVLEGLSGTDSDCRRKRAPRGRRPDCNRGGGLRRTPECRVPRSHDVHDRRRTPRGDLRDGRRGLRKRTDVSIDWAPRIHRASPRRRDRALQHHATRQELDLGPCQSALSVTAVAKVSGTFLSPHPMSTVARQPVPAGTATASG